MEKVVLTIMLMTFFLSAIMENQRCYIIAQNVDEALQAATNMVGVENMHNASKGLREGNSGAYRYDPFSDNWDTNIMTSQIKEEIKNSLGLSSKDSKLSLQTSKGIEYMLSDITITYENARLAGSNSKTLTFVTSAKLEIPLTFMGEALPPIKLNRKVKTTYMNKF